MNEELTSGNLLKGIAKFSIPYLIASFLQTFYGMADLFVTGQFNAAAEVTAVSVGSQIMHMATVIFVGLAMGTTVSISHAVGQKNYKRIGDIIGNSVITFAAIAVGSMVLALLAASSILRILQTPTEAFSSAKEYLIICFIGLPFIVAYNVISSIFRGLGDTKRPMIFVAIAGVINVGLDILLIGSFGMGAAGAAIATVSSQAISVVLAFFAIRKMDIGTTLQRENFRYQREIVSKLFKVGAPIACQDGIIQVSFLVITMIANMRGLAVATAVGIVEKVIGFIFLVPSAMLSTVSAIAAQNAGAGKHERGRLVLRYGIMVCVGFGLIVGLICQFVSPQIVSLFVKNEPEVVALGGQYLKAYCWDCMIAGVHFCFSGYFSAYQKSMYSFIHNIASVILVRIPGAYFTSIRFPETLYPMGLAAPLGSLLSVGICIALYRRFCRQQKEEPVRV